MGPRARREAVSVPSTSRVRRPLYDWHLGRERFLKREEEAFRAAPEHLDAIPKIFRHPYWRMRLGHALERAFAAENTALSDPGYVEQASGFLLTDLRRGAGRTATNPDAVPEYFSFDPDLGETGEEEYESDDFFDETSEDEELLPEAPEPEDDDVFDDESDDGETLSFLAPVGPDDPVAKAFREYWETTEAQPEYRRQLEVIEKACDKEFFDWFSLNMDDIPEAASSRGIPRATSRCRARRFSCGCSARPPRTSFPTKTGRPRSRATHAFCGRFGACPASTTPFSPSRASRAPCWARSSRGTRPSFR